MGKPSKLDKIEAQEIHKPARRNYTRRPVEVNGIDDVWCADLVDMRQFAKQNKGYNYILTVIDVLSRYAWAIPLKNKKAGTVLDAMTKIITESDRHPKKLWIDKGAEFLNDEFQSNFHNTYHTYSPFHAAPVERFNRTLKTIMWYKFTKHDTKNWVDRLDKLLRKYNNRVHSSIHMTPKKASDPSNAAYLLDLQDKKVDKIKTTKPKFKVNDIVRISKQKGTFDKGYTANWSFDLFKIVEVLPMCLDEFEREFQPLL